MKLLNKTISIFNNSCFSISYVIGGNKKDIEKDIDKVTYIWYDSSKASFGCQKQKNIGGCSNDRNF